MNTLISGAGGLIGSALVESLVRCGHQVTRLARSASAANGSAVTWDPASGTLDAGDVEGFDAVVHLGGENIARGPWTEEKKARIRASRVDSTRLLSETLARASKPPPVLLVASAIGYYGSRGDEQLDEDSPPGTGFLAHVCRDWEAAAKPAAEAGIRVVHLRTGLVLAAHGGALVQMLRIFRWGFGGRLGSGSQYMSWITLSDVVGAIQHVLLTGGLRGPVNLVAPRPVTNRRFTRTLGRVLRRPTCFPIPACALRMVWGAMADELLLASSRVVPQRLMDSRYTFRDPELEPALRRMLT